MTSRIRQMGLAALLGASIAALPVASSAEPVRYAVGVKAWAADWVALNPNGEFRSYVGGMYGPVAIARYRSAFVGATYFTGSLFFPFTQVVISGTNVTTTNTTITATRTDLDLTAGYYFAPTFGVIAGYKNVTFDFIIPARPGSGGAATQIEQTSSGPFAGVLGSYSLGRSRFALYGNLTYSLLQRKTGSVSESFGGPAGEIGLAYRLSSWPVTIAEAYKYQRFSDSTGDFTDTFQGVIFSVAYSF